MAENIQKILAKKEGLSKNFLLGYLENKRNYLINMRKNFKTMKIVIKQTLQH
jgi:hypothetical protein